VRGADPHALDCFATFCEQRYPDFELLFGVLDSDDSAVDVVRELQRTYPVVPIRLVIADHRLGTNLKICNLENMLGEASHDLLVISDADIRVQPDHLEHVVECLARPGVGLATCPYRGIDVRSPSAALEALGIATEFLPGALLVARFGRPDFAFGSTIALTRTMLEKVGGFTAIADYLADDFQLGNRVAATGAAVAVCPEVVESVISNEGVSSMLAHRLRWARTVRVCRPAGHAASLITQSTIFALAYLAASGFSATGWIVLAAQQIVRAAAAWSLSVGSLGNRELRPWFWLLPASDVLNFALWLGSWIGSDVTWRGTRFRIARGGKMTPV
jgi:ceramide glucosyltransferase